jgi:hypothetical protein
LLGCLLCTGCAQPLDSTECDALLNRYTEQLLREGKPAISAVQIQKGQERARSLARERPEFEFDACAERVSRRQYTCAIAAPTVDEIERCLKR